MLLLYLEALDAPKMSAPLECASRTRQPGDGVSVEHYPLDCPACVCGYLRRTVVKDTKAEGAFVVSDASRRVDVDTLVLYGGSNTFLGGSSGFVDGDDD